MLALIAFAEKQYDESLTLIENILFRDPANIEARLLQAQVWLAKGETKRALEGLENLSNSLPKHPAIKYDLARAYLQDRKPAQAAAALKKAIAVYPDYNEAILLLGEVNLQTGNSQEVIASILDLLKKQPDLVAAQLILAKAYIAQGQANDAIALIREQIKASPKDPSGHLRLGLLLRRVGTIEEARKALEEAQKLSPDNMLAFSQLVDLDVQIKDFSAATLRVRAQLEKTPESAIAHFMEGKVYAAQGDWNRAESAFIKALELDRNFPGAYGMLISTYLASNNLPKAISQLEAILSNDPKNTRALMLSGLLYDKLNNFSKAREAYEKLLSIDPDFAPALNNLAYLYVDRLNDLNKAYELARKARALKSSDPAIADTLGWALYKRGEYQQALLLLQESARNLPTNPEIQFHLGMASYMTGRIEEARTAFRQAAEASGSFPDKEEAKRRLSLLGDAGSERTQVSGDEVTFNEQSEDPSAQVRLGESYEKQGAFAEAAASYEKAIELNPNLLSANAQLAQLHAGPLQDTEKALKFAKKARELAPNDPKIIGILGSVAYQTGNFTWAYSLLQESSRQLPSNPEVLHQLAWSAYSLGKVSEAWQAMESILAVAPDSIQSSDAKLFLEMAALTEAGKDPGAAERQVEQVLKTRPDYVPALMARAAILLQRGESERAAAIYSEILRRLPDFIPAQKRLGSLYAANPEKRDQAYTLLMKARMASPDDPELAQILAKLSYDRKEYAYAVQLLQESAKKKPLEAESLYYLGMSYRQVNEQAQSEDALQRALATGLREPQSTDAKRVLAEP
jgi:tetratricopeptide (TPR) repeat protein